MFMAKIEVNKRGSWDIIWDDVMIIQDFKEECLYAEPYKMYSDMWDLKSHGCEYED
jgi:hypothetical protein